MNAFKFKGYDSSGKKIEGEISAASISDAERKISSQDVTIISLIPASVRRGFTTSKYETISVKSSGKRVKDTEVTGVLRDLAVMAQAGVPFVDALDSVIIATPNHTIKKSLTTVKAEIVGGKSLSQALRSAPQMFSSLVCDMVRVAEEGGMLDRALNSGADYLERSTELKKKIMNAMMYPMVLTCVALITVVVLVVFVLPKFADVFVSMNADVPITTQWMLSFGKVLKSKPWFVVAVIAAIVYGIRWAWKSPVASKKLATLFIRVPVIGELIRRLAVARAMESISTLLSTNVSLMAALEHGAKVSGNPVIEQSILETREKVEQGASFSEALSITRAFPSQLIQMVSVGEKTGRLSDLMTTSAKHLQTEVDSKLKALVSIVEPVMIVLMGAIVGTITLSVVLPIYSAIQNVK